MAVASACLLSSRVKVCPGLFERLVGAVGPVSTQQVQHIVVVFCRRHAAAKDPLEEVRVGTFEQCFEPAQLARIEACQATVGKRPEEQIAFLRTAMPALEEEPVASSCHDISVHRCRQLLIQRLRCSPADSADAARQQAAPR